jgi:hypothetical protein
MTEAEWLESPAPTPMLESFSFRSTDRKLRLFCIACCHQNWDQFSDPRERRILHVAERMADGTATEGDCKSAQDLWLEVSDEKEDEFARYVPVAVISPRVDAVDASSCARSMAYGAIYLEGGFEGLEDELGFDQAAFLRDIFGNPFRPVAFNPRWRTADAVGLARGIYEERAFDRLPLLADALMDAGCGDDQVLEHCRSEGPHVRGCWVVDLVLGKE